jgi:hypothetical protein
MWQRVSALMIAVVAIAVAFGCGHETPTRPVTTGQLKFEALLWKHGCVSAYSLVDRPGEVAVRFVRFAARDPRTGQRRIFTYDEAVAVFAPSDTLVVVPVWRVVPQDRAQSFTALRGVAVSADEFLVPDDPGWTDPNPVPPPSGCPCGYGCNCCTGGHVSWGCQKCCYAT